MVHVDYQCKKTNNDVNPRGEKLLYNWSGIIALMLIGSACSSTDRRRYFAQLRSQHAVAGELARADTSLKNFDGLIHVVLVNTDRDALETIVNLGLSPQIKRLIDNGKVLDSAPERFVQNGKILGLDLSRRSTHTSQSKRTNSLTTITLDYSSAKWCRYRDGSESSNYQKTRVFRISPRRICVRQQWLKAQFSRDSAPLPLPQIATYMLNDQQLKSTLDQLPYRHPLIIAQSAVQIDPFLQLSSTPGGRLLAESELTLSQRINALESRRTGFLPMRILNSRSDRRLSFAEILQLKVGSSNLAELLQRGLGPGYLMVPYDNSNRQGLPMQDLIVQNSKRRRSRIQLDYGPLLRFYHRPLTPIAAIDLEDDATQGFRYLSEEEWHLVGLKEANLEMNKIPSFAHVMQSLPNADLGFYLERGSYKPKPFFMFSSNTLIRAQTISGLNIVPSLARIRGLLESWSSRPSTLRGP